MTRLGGRRAAIVALLVLVCLGRVPGAGAQPAGAVRPSATALRVPPGAVHLDGRLDEADWQRATPIDRFVQTEPAEGAPASAPVVARILYDDSGLYVGVRLAMPAGVSIQSPMGRRDEVGQAEHFLVAIDTFLDRRTAYVFGVTSAGVRIDRYHARDDEVSFDARFDPVWDAQTTTDANGWTAELWIPFSQLRFSAAPEIVFGLNLRRFTPNTNEASYWVPVPKTVTAWASRFGDLRGITGIGPARRIELLPYVASSSTHVADRDPADPFDSGLNLEGRAGADAKIGLGSNLTLDLTVNPDFGQVEADPAEVNLTVFETIFAEKRPFFLEGAPLLNLGVIDNFFYSRRIGAAPSAPVAGDFVDYPRTETILAAGKLTGRLKSGTSIGALASLTGEETARVSNRQTPGVERVKVAARTASTVARVQQEFGPARSTVSGMFTFMHRDLPTGDPLAALYVRDAVSAATDSVLRFRGGAYELRSFAGLSLVRGDAPAIERVQRSAVHYFQRPDQDYARLDPTRTSLGGYKFGSEFERMSGRHWLWWVQSNLESPGFETNDLGRLRSADGLVLNARLRYRETVPNRVFQNYAFRVSSNNEWNNGGDRQSGSITANAEGRFRNFWRAEANFTRYTRNQDERLTRGGPLMQTPRGWELWTELRNNDAASTAWSGSVLVGDDENGGFFRTVQTSLTVNPSPRWRALVTPTVERSAGSQQYVMTAAGGRDATYGKRYVFSRIDRTTYSVQFRLGFTLRPDVNVDYYAEPFTASGRYGGFGELARPRTRALLRYGDAGTTVERLADGTRVVTDGAQRFTIANRDFHVRSFRSNLVLRWEWRPGSTLYVVWQQDRREDDPFAGRVTPGDLGRALTAPGSNYFVVKTSFWMPWR